MKSCVHVHADRNRCTRSRATHTSEVLMNKTSEPAHRLLLVIQNNANRHDLLAHTFTLQGLSLQEGWTHTCMNTHCTAARDKSYPLPLTAHSHQIALPLSVVSCVSFCLFVYDSLLNRWIADGYWELQPGGHHGRKEGAAAPGNLTPSLEQPKTHNHT